MTDVTTITADIISAYVSKNSIPADDLIGLLKNVHKTMVSLVGEKPVVAEASKPEPAVSTKKSVQHDAITCLACGMRLKTIKRHVMASHGQTLPEYKAYWSLPQDYPTTAPAYAETRSTLATKIGLGRKPRIARSSPDQRQSAPVPEQAKKRTAAARPKKKAVRKEAA